jgi:hypothetical protein
MMKRLALVLLLLNLLWAAWAHDLLHEPDRLDLQLRPDALQPAEQPSALDPAKP